MAGLIALSFIPFLRAHASPSTVVSTWTLVLFLSFVGWGDAVNAIAQPGRRLDVGLRAALGVGVHLAIGGLLAACSLVCAGAIVGSAVCGLGCLGVVEWRQRRCVQRDWQRAGRIALDSPVFVMAVLALAIAALIQYFAFAVPLSSDHFTVYDDSVAYFGFARQLLAQAPSSSPLACAESRAWADRATCRRRLSSSPRYGSFTWSTAGSVSF